MGVGYAFALRRGTSETVVQARFGKVDLPIIHWDHWRHVRLTGKTVSVGDHQCLLVRARIFAGICVAYSGLAILAPLTGFDALLPEAIAARLESIALISEHPSGPSCQAELACVEDAAYR